MSEERVRELERELEHMRCRETLLKADAADIGWLRVGWCEDLIARGMTQDAAWYHMEQARRRYAEKFGEDRGSVLQREAAPAQSARDSSAPDLFQVGAFA